MPDVGLFVKLPRHVLMREDLTPATKLVFADICDRLRGNTTTWPGLRRIAKATGLGVSTVAECVDRLEAAGLLTVKRADGNPAKRSNVYELVGRSDSEAPQKPSATKSEHRAPRKANTERHENRTNRDPIKENHTIRLPASPQQADIERIYDAYPRKIGKAAALTAIGKALTTIAGRNGVPDAAAWLLERVQAFARSPAGQAGKFTPHPATFFNAGRYDDDESEWNRKGDEERPNASRIAAARGKYAGIGRTIALASPAARCAASADFARRAANDGRG